MESYHFLILGTEKRQQYLAEFLKAKGNVVRQAATYEPGYHDAVLLPVPQTAKFLRENYTRLQKGQVVYGCNFPVDLVEICEKNGIRFVDYMKEDGVASRNAVATAEGAVAEALLDACVSIHGSRCLVVGYGRCGAVLADKLVALNADVTVMERKADKRAKAQGFGCQVTDFSVDEERMKSFDFIFNTVPAMVLDASKLNMVQPDVRIVDIASRPGGVDFEYCQKNAIHAKLCLGLPGKYAPKSAAGILVEVIEKTFPGEG